MFRRNRKNIAGLVLAAIVAVALGFWGTTPATGAQPPFSATINVTPNLDVQVCLGETLTLTANYTTNRDVTRREWYVNGVGQGVETIPAGQNSAGSDTFDFIPPGTGVYVIAFRIWHHNANQADRDAREEVTVTVTDCSDNDCPAAPAIANAYLRDVKGLRPNDPLHREIIEEIAHVMHSEFGYDPCAPGYAQDVESYIDSHWTFD